MIKDFLRLIRDKGLMSVNRILKKEYIPNPKEHLYIETSDICNLACRFCAYTKTKRPKQIMDTDFFCDIVDRATKFGFYSFGLTPITGDVFTDKDFLAKLDYLEKNPLVKNYSFYTNFTLSDNQTLDKLLKLRKLSVFNVSLYGHDSDSFVKITRSNRKTYERLVANINYLLEHSDKLPFSLYFGLRSYNSFDFKTSDSDLCVAVKKVMKKTNAEFYVTKQFNNWGGFISQADVEGLDITIGDGKVIDKKGPCALIFYKNIVMVDGKINACACRDVDTTMVIGDLNTQSFNEIYSLKNKAYMDLINEQVSGSFRPICETCDFYRTIYKYHPVYRNHSKKPVTLKEFFKSLNS